MAHTINVGGDRSRTASVDMSAQQFTFVLFTGTADEVAQNTASGGDTDGVLQNDPSAAGQAAQIRVSGVSKVVAGAAVAIGDSVMSDTTGRAITATGTGAFIQGTCVQAAANANEICSVELQKAGQLN